MVLGGSCSANHPSPQRPAGHATTMRAGCDGKWSAATVLLQFSTPGMREKLVPSIRYSG